MDTLTRHILAAKDSLCTEGQDPFEGGLCLHFATFEAAGGRFTTASLLKLSAPQIGLFDLRVVKKICGIPLERQVAVL